ncbi:MAG: M20/M25/M40 family metallo-hydrolase [Planctomycetota bacterium]
MNQSAFEREALRQHAEQQRGQFEDLLKRFVEVPSVSMEPERQPEIQKMADLACETLRSFGAEARLIPTKGNPIIHARYAVDPAAPTITIYNHMDVQPGGAKEEWKTEPFVFTKEGDTYFGRGTTDDKGPALSALFGAKYAIDHGAKVNVSFLWELEEEIGSPSFEAGIAAEAGALRTDAVVVSDTVWISRARPACPSGLRGLQGFTLHLETAGTDQHSGTAGGAARNPIAELMGVICQCFDPVTGKVKIKGFYDDVVALSRDEAEMFKKCGFSVAQFKKDHGFKSLRVNQPLEVMKRIWAGPTFEVHGVVGGYQGPGVKTIIPPRGEVKVTCRLVPNQDPKKIVKLIVSHVKKLNKDVVVKLEGTLAPYRGMTQGPFADAIRGAMKFAFGKEPVFVREGGSIGAVVTMEDVLECPVGFLGLSLPEHGYHAPNENYDWQQAAGGMAAFARLFEQVARLSSAQLKSVPKPAKAKGAAKKKRKSS